MLSSDIVDQDWGGMSWQPEFRTDHSFGFRPTSCFASAEIDTLSFMDDAHLMRRAQSGDVSAFEELVRRYREALWRVAVSKLGDRQRADDVVQETLLAAYAARHTFNPQFSVRTWLWTILFRLCQRQWKRQQRPADAGGTVGALVTESLVSTEVTGLEQLLHLERRAELAKAMGTLPEAEADALRLRFFAGLRFDEIAAAMNSSVSGAKQRVKHGLERLAVRLRHLSGVER